MFSHRVTAPSDRHRRLDKVVAEPRNSPWSVPVKPLTRSVARGCRSAPRRSSQSSTMRRAAFSPEPRSWSCACRHVRPPCAPDTASAGLGDAVDPAAFFLGRDNGKPELLLQGTREDTADGVWLPPRRRPHLVNRDALGPAQPPDHPGP